MSGPREKIQFSLAVWGRGKQLVDSNFNVLSCPMKEQVYLGIDLGAESGRVMAGAWNGSQIRVEELHRFANGPVQVAETLRWDVLRLWLEIQHGLGLAAKHYGDKIVSAGVDTWGVDFVLLTKNGEMLGQPYHYRDGRVAGMYRAGLRAGAAAEIFARTGLQFMEINTLYQLLALQRAQPGFAGGGGLPADDAGFFPLVLVRIAGGGVHRATTSQCLNPVRRDWAFDLLEKLVCQQEFSPRSCRRGRPWGGCANRVCARTGLGPIKWWRRRRTTPLRPSPPIPTAHTGRANWAYISSGTWSLMGVETQNAVLSERVPQLNLTNEGGIDGTFRLLKNITGLWLVQQCKKAFEARGRNLDYGELARLAEEAPGPAAIIDPDDPRFANPPDMPAAIQSCCRERRPAGAGK